MKKKVGLQSDKMPLTMNHISRADSVPNVLTMFFFPEMFGKKCQS